MDAFHKLSEKAYFESGIQEHHTATMAGAASKEGFASFFSTFGTFGVTEVFNQLRLNDINHTNLKLVCTHLGLDVGEDGQTHQCIDYIGLLQNLFGFSIFMPADPNQTDRIVRYAAGRPGNFFVGMGRSKIPPIPDESGEPAFAGAYRFVPGKADRREGKDGQILSHGASFTMRSSPEELAAKHESTWRSTILASINARCRSHRASGGHRPDRYRRRPPDRHGPWRAGRDGACRKRARVRVCTPGCEKIRTVR